MRVLSSVHNVTQGNDTFPVEYLFTDDIEDLQAYETLVKTYYHKELHIDLASNELDTDLVNNSDHERIMVVKQEGQVVGGSKITVSSPTAGHRLPMEADGVDVTALLPEGRDNVIYAELTRLVVSSEYRGKDILGNVVYEMAKFARSQQAGFMFAGAPPVNALLYRRVCRSLGFNSYIRDDVKYPLKRAYAAVKELKLVVCEIGDMEFK